MKLLQTLKTNGLLDKDFLEVTITTLVALLIGGAL
jgi:hypothetical protein